ncbi:MAG TPA: dihydroneopterin aldolase [Saprospiraceae bacterium]|nr:dihydroneopterin aldolase [Saprospiraceae bacterium]HMP13228.1 dihydroneopterin aldolase [Saprospiraceae bacterium]
MAIIALEGAYFRANHGFYPEENETGNDFILDVYVDVDIELAAEMDELYEPVEQEATEDETPLSANYETIYLLCEQEMKKTSKLLESVAQRIADRLNDYFENLRGVRVRLKKVQPPLRGRVDCAWVEVRTGVFELPDGESLRQLRKLVKDWDEFENMDEF